MTTYGDQFSGRVVYLYLDVTESSTNAAANTSVVSFTLRLVGNSSSYGLSATSTYSISINGTNYTGTWSYDFRSNNTPTLRTGTQTITHNTDGSKVISVSASAVDNAGNCGSAAIGAQNFTLTNFVRVPSTPGTPTLGRTNSNITASTTGSTFYGSGSNYVWQYSLDGTNYNSVTGTGTSVSFDCGSTTSTCYVRVYANDSEGSSGWANTSIVGVPTAPATITTSRIARDVTVVAGTATGTGITGYYAQSSSDNGSTWSTAVAMTSQSYTYTGLTAGATYLFRTYATNSIGSSAYATSSSVFVPAGGKRWTGSAWTSNSTAKRWDGTSWVDITTAKRWNGTAWVDMS